MFIETNANPYGKHIDDCAIRAITLATCKDYFDVMDGLIEVADTIGKEEWSIDEIRCISKYLTSIGWECCEPTTYMTVKQFAQQFTDPRIVIVRGHATFTCDTNTYDTWNCNKYKVHYSFRKCNS